MPADLSLPESVRAVKLRGQAPFLVVVIALLSALSVNAATEVKHPNLLLHREEIAQMRDKIAKYPWAADLFARTRDLSTKSDAYPASAFGGVQVRAQALCYVITGERNYAGQARAFLLHQARDDLPRLENRDPNLTVYQGLNIWQGAWCTYAWAYDLTYDTFAPEERELVERWLRAAGHVIIDDYNHIHLES